MSNKDRLIRALAQKYILTWAALNHANEKLEEIPSTACGVADYDRLEPKYKKQVNEEVDKLLELMYRDLGIKPLELPLSNIDTSKPIGNFLHLYNFCSNQVNKLAVNDEGVQDLQSYMKGQVSTYEDIVSIIQAQAKIDLDKSQGKHKPTEKELLAMPLNSILTYKTKYKLYSVEHIIRRVVGGWEHLNLIGIGSDLKASNSCFVPEKAKPNPPIVVNNS